MRREETFSVTGTVLVEVENLSHLQKIVKAARRGAAVIELPVGYRPRFAGQSKVGGTLRGTILATYRILSVTLRYSLGRREVS